MHASSTQPAFKTQLAVYRHNTALPIAPPIECVPCIDRSEWYPCDQPGCTFRSKYKCNVVQHKKSIHSIGLVWFYCVQPGCTYKAKQRVHVETHEQDVHHMNVKHFGCTQPGCVFVSKRRSGVVKHLADVHDIGVKWHACTVADCKYKGKNSWALKQHMQSTHNTSVWFHCPYPGCNHKSKVKRNLLDHAERRHGMRDPE